MTLQKDLASKRHFELFLYLDINMHDLLDSKMLILNKIDIFKFTCRSIVAIFMNKHIHEQHHSKGLVYMLKKISVNLIK